MHEDFRHTANDGYIQNEGDQASRSARVELSANIDEDLSEASKHAICIRMLNADENSHCKPHVGVIVPLDVAKALGRWLLEAADNANEDGLFLIDPPEEPARIHRPNLCVTGDCQSRKTSH